MTANQTILFKRVSKNTSLLFYLIQLKTYNKVLVKQMSKQEKQQAGCARGKLYLTLATSYPSLLESGKLYPTERNVGI